jgi:hypothetical protein
VRLGSWLKNNSKRGYRFSLFLMSGATALVVAACYGMADTMGISYSNSVQHILASECDSCHSGATPAGDYNTDSYAGVMGGGTDAVANVIAADPTSALLQKLNSDPDHNVSQLDADRLYNWIVNNGATQY